jgi:tryptophanyl-tRNA synthetase
MAQKVFSGFRPTGKQHIGNYLGAIQNWIMLQDNYDCVYCVVDIHALTTMESTKNLQQDIYDMVLDWLAAGIDPEKSIIFVQSHVPQVMELSTLFGMLTSLSWLLRVPTFKEKVKMQPQNVNYGLVGYPVLMAADIALYKGEVVPVGEDQLPHIELAREIVRKFNSRFGNIFPEPQGKLTSSPLILGLDGVQKMSKSYDNHIEITASPEEILRRVMTAVTDPSRRYRSDPGNPELCNIYSLHKIYTDPLKVKEISSECLQAGIGCVDCKKLLAQNIATAFEPFRARRAILMSKPAYIKDVLTNGADRAQSIAIKTMNEVRDAIGLLPRILS